jgi:hypothetical protein
MVLSLQNKGVKQSKTEKLKGTEKSTPNMYLLTLVEWYGRLLFRLQPSELPTSIFKTISFQNRSID